MEASIQRYPWAVLAIRAAAVSLAVFVGVASFFLSFTALADVAVRSHVPPSQAWLWPCTVDGATLLATLGAVVCMSEHRARRFFWAVLIGGLLVSVGGNDLHAVLPPQQELPWMLRAAVGAVTGKQRYQYSPNSCSPRRVLRSRPRVKTQRPSSAAFGPCASSPTPT